MCFFFLFFILFRFPIYIFPRIWGSLRPCRYHLDQRNMPRPWGEKKSEWLYREVSDFTKWHDVLNTNWIVRADLIDESLPSSSGGNSCTVSWFYWGIPSSLVWWGTPPSPALTFSFHISCSLLCFLYVVFLCLFDWLFLFIMPGDGLVWIRLIKILRLSSTEWAVVPQVP